MLQESREQEACSIRSSHLKLGINGRRSDLSSILVEFWGTHPEHDGPVHKEYMIH
ncbi:hypothetical protein BDL97_06G063400 [Sphagnum fallax]|nr:hypothetical protein BDL97_06G063400 [Sphagnum fallax]